MESGSSLGSAPQTQPPAGATSANSIWSLRPSEFQPPSAGTSLPFPPSKLRLDRGERVPVPRTTTLGIVAALWGIGGVLFLLLYAVARLVPIASEGREYALGWSHWVVLVVNTLLMAYMEGYRGFQKSLAPRVVSRARQLAQQPSVLGAVLAPAYCYGIVLAPRREIAARGALTVMIIGFIVAVRTLDAPWRSLLDVGVIVGLSWGIISIAALGWQALTDPAAASDEPATMEAGAQTATE